MLDIRTGKEMSRRDFGKGIAAILAAGCAPTIVSGAMMRMTGARMATMFGGDSTPLPYDKEVEYITATGSQYILIDAYPTYDTVVEFTSKNVNNDGNVISSGGSWPNVFQFSFNNDYFQFVYLSSRSMINYSITPPIQECKALTEIVDGKYNVVYNGTRIAQYDVSELYYDYKLCFFATNRRGEISERSTYSLYGEFKISNSNSNMVIIPVRFTNELGLTEGGLYDKVGKKLYKNSGSGNFIIGPDKA